LSVEQQWPADQVERRALDKLVPHARNSRTHSEEQVAQVAASMREWGWTNPVLVDEDGTIIAGHARVQAARKLGWTEAPVMVARGWTDEQKRAYVIADNKLALNAGWDEAMLGAELQALQASDFDELLTGFSEDELTALTAERTEGNTDEDEAPEAQEHAVTEPGDVWLLGKHRVRCGDSTSADDVAALMGEQQADFIFTSPPYDQQRAYKSEISDWTQLMCDVFSILPVKSGAQVLVNLGLVHKDGEWIEYWRDWMEWMRSSGWRAFAWYVWDQGPGLPGDWNGRLAPSHEFIFHFNKQPKKARKTETSKHAGSANHGTGLRGKDGTVKGYAHIGRDVQPKKIRDSVFRVMRHKARGIETAHPAVFPVALCEEVQAAYTKQDDAIYDPFCGSGTQLIAAEKNARVCYGMELAPEYVDVIVKRWQEFTGKDATLEGDGRTFNEVSGERVPADAT
jgi:DNA modification methylase